MKKLPDSAADRVARQVAQHSRVQRLPCADPARRKRLERDAEKWLRMYLAEAYFRPFEKPHRAIIDRSIHASRTGGRFAVAAERGLGKSVLLWGIVTFLALTGEQPFPVCAPWDAKALKRAFRFWKNALCFNPRILADYPDICAPFAHSRGVSQKLFATTWHDTGKPTGTQLAVGDGLIVLPDNRGCIGGVTINSNPRGMNHPMPDGRILRPTLVLLDDVQDRETAKSRAQIQDTIEIIDGDVAGMGEAGTDLPMLMSGNCIEPGDVMAHYLESDRWQSMRIPAVEAWPAGWDEGRGPAAELWREWWSLFQTGQGAATFYRAHKSAMTRGMQMSAKSVYKKEKGIPDAYCGIMRSYCKMGPEAFQAEKQQEPFERTHAQYEIRPADVLSHAVDHPRLAVPPAATIIGGHCDINRSGLHWSLAAFDQDMSPHVCDYGRYPGRGDLWPENATQHMRQTAIFAGLAALCQHVAATRYVREGAAVTPGLVLIDASYESDIVHRFCESARLPFRVAPAIGRAAHKYRWSKATLVGSPGEACHIQRPANRRCPYVMFNADHWREVMQRAFLQPSGSPGSCTLYEPPNERYHAAYAAHLVAEKLVAKYETELGWRWEWRTEPGTTWDWADSLTGSWVAAAIQGLTTSGQPAPLMRRKTSRRPKVRMVQV